MVITPLSQIVDYARFAQAAIAVVLTVGLGHDNRHGRMARATQLLTVRRDLADECADLK